MKSGVNQGITSLADEFGIGKDIGKDIQGMIDSINGIQSAFSDFLTNFIIVAKAPWDFLMGGTSTEELKSQLLEKMEANPAIAANAGITPELVNSQDFTGEDARAMLMAFGDNVNAKTRVAEVFKKINDRVYQSNSTDMMYYPSYHRGEINMTAIPKSWIKGLYLYRPGEFRNTTGNVKGFVVY